GVVPPTGAGAVAGTPVTGAGAGAGVVVGVGAVTTGCGPAWGVTTRVAVTAPFTPFFRTLPIVPRAFRVALPLAAATAFFSGESTRGLRGLSPKSASTSIEPDNATSRACRTPS